MNANNTLVQKNQIVPLTITGMTAEGNGVGKYEGMAVFVPQTAIGDTLDVRIVKVCKQYAYGIVDTIHTPSPDRIEPDCPVFRTCGGCVFRHISYEAECRIKADLVTDVFSRIGHIEPKTILPILGAAAPDGYRNKTQYPCGADGASGELCFGFYAARSHRLIPQTDCRLQPPLFREILEQCRTLLQPLSPYDERTGKGILRHVYIRQGYHSKEVMVCFVVAKAAAQVLRPISETLMQAFPEIRSVMMNVNPKQTNVILGEQTQCLCGKPTISDMFCGIPVLLSPQSFYQVNTEQAERLFAVVRRLANPQKHELLLDLYCGIGVIGLSMADVAGRILGVEVVPQAVANAKQNAQNAGIDNAEFIAGDAGSIAAQFALDGVKPNIIVLDPPRKGCDEQTLRACIQMQPNRMVMVSCNPATAARDAAFLAEHGYAVDVLQPVDLFPRTGHVECVVLMSRDKK